MDRNVGKVRVRMVFVMAAFLLIATPMTAAAKTTQQQLSEAQAQQQETQQALSNTQDNLSSLQGTKNALQKELGSLNADLDAASLHLEDLEDQILKKEAEIAQAEMDLQKAQEIEAEQYESMLVRIRFMYENSEATTLEMLFSSGSFAEFLNKNEYIEKVEAYDRAKLDEYKETCELVEAQKVLLEGQLVELSALKTQAEEEQKRIGELVTKTANSVAAYADQIEDTQAQMLAYEKQIEEQNNNIAALKAKIEEEKRLAALAAQSAKRDISTVVFDENDRYLLANIIYCEAGNQPYEGKVAVGAVVINRLLSSVFPNTISGVIYQKNQFSPVASGRYALALANNKATASCYQAADAAMAGETTVADCLFFRTPVDYIEPKYKIGGHIFY